MYTDDECENRINKAYEIVKNIKGRGCEEDKETAIESILSEINKNYLDTKKLFAAGDDYPNPIFNVDVTPNELVTLIKGLDAIKHGPRSLDFIRPDSLAIKYGIDDEIPFNDLIRGYGIFVVKKIGWKKSCVIFRGR